MKDVNGLRESRNIKDAICAGWIANAYLLDARPYGSHWPPIEWFKTFLDLTEFESCLASGVIGKVSNLGA
jgi:hypothetical protein